MFSRFFKPRWQHTDAEVRARAIRELHPLSDNDVLATLARGDASARVRASAAAKLSDLKLLDQIIQRDPEQSVRDAASTQIQNLLAGISQPGLSLQNRLRVIALTDNQSVLNAVARLGVDSATRLAAAEKLSDETSLMALALDGADAELRISVAARLTDPDNLRRLARDGRDKKVVRLARDKLKAHLNQQQEQQQHQQRAAELIEHLHSHSQRAFDNLYSARLQQLTQSWHEVIADTNASQRELGESLLNQCRQRIEQWQQTQAQEQAVRAAEQELAAAISTLEESLQALNGDDDWPPANSLAAIFASQQRRWQEAATVGAATDTLQPRYQALEHRWLRLVQMWRDKEAAPAGTDWPADLPKPPALRAAAEAEPMPAVDSEIDRTLGTLSSALRQRQLKFANRLWHKLEQLVDTASPAQRARMEKLRPQLDELRDWHAFAADPKKDQLCQQMEQLANADLPAQEKADAIQLLHDQWRELMSADQQSDQALWERFRSASDAAWIPCREHFAELDRERAANLGKRLTLCDQLEHYLASLDRDNHSDWAAVAEIRRTAPQEWSRYQPVRFTDARDASKRFSALLKQLDELLDGVAAAHSGQLEKLIGEAEALLQSDDSRQATEQFKLLQKRWQETGWVPANTQRKLYKRFRTLADQVFARRQETRQAQQQQSNSDAQALRSALTTLEQALASAGDDNAMKLLGELVEQVSAMPCPRREEKLQQHREALVRDARQRRQRWPQWQRWSALRQRILSAPLADESAPQLELAVALEVSAGIESPEQAREQRMQWQLQQLSSAMKSSSGVPADRCRNLLEQSDALQQGVSEAIRQRLLAVWDTLEPKS